MNQRQDAAATFAQSFLDCAISAHLRCVMRLNLRATRGRAFATFFIRHVATNLNTPLSNADHVKMLIVHSQHYSALLKFIMARSLRIE